MARKGRVVLVGAVGMSPAVLTETVWALAHEEPATVVDEVVAITTAQGRNAIREQLLDSGVWQDLCKTLAKEGVPVAGKMAFGSSDSIRVIGDGSRDFADISSIAENEAAGDFILRVLRSYTGEADTTVIASIAGGRKTMSALMLACMCLVGREQDRVCHVLVNPPYDSFALQPRFMFPLKGKTHRLPHDSGVYATKDAVIQLADIPFVRLLQFHGVQSRLNGGYRAVVAKTQRAIPDIDLPEVVVDATRGILTVGDTEVDLKDLDLAVCISIAECHLAGCLIASWQDIEPRLRRLYSKDYPSGDCLHGFREHAFPDMKDDIRKAASRLRTKLTHHGVSPDVSARLLPNIRRKVTAYPHDKIKIIGLPALTSNDVTTGDT